MPAKLKEVGAKLLSGVFGIAIVVLLIMWGMNAQKNREAKFPWRGSFFTISEERQSIAASKEFKTVAECRTWANSEASSRELKTGEWGFECGTNCTWKENTIVSGKQVKTYQCTEVVIE